MVLPHTIRLSAALLLVVLATTTPIVLGSLSPFQVRRTQENIIRHHSFSPPILGNYYGDGELDHWSIGGTAVVTDHYLRLTPDRTGAVGYAWNTEKLDLQAFSLAMGLRLHRPRGTPSGDGVGLWITVGDYQQGPLVGYTSTFKGIGIIFDTFDNDGDGDNPAIRILYSDGKDPQKHFSPETDYKGQTVGGCSFDFRADGYDSIPTVRLLYLSGMLTVYVSPDRESNERLCATVRNLRLDVEGEEYHVGVTAQTGGLADNHDVVFLHIFPLSNVHYDHDIYRAPAHHPPQPEAPGAQPAAPNPPQQEQQPPQQQQQQQQQQPPQQKQQQQPPQQQQQQQPSSGKQEQGQKPDIDQQLADLKKELEEAKAAAAAANKKGGKGQRPRSSPGNDGGDDFADDDDDDFEEEEDERDRRRPVRRSRRERHGRTVRRRTD